MPTSPYNPQARHPYFPLFCPCQGCTYFWEPENYIIKDGTYRLKGGERRQRFYCYLGKHRFSETAYSGLFGHHGSLKEYVQTAKMSTYGMSCEQIADVLERDARTILGWQKALGEKSQWFHLAVCAWIGLTVTFVQMDEIWSYLQRKTRQLWLFISFEAHTKFWVNFELGSRTGQTAKRLLKNFMFLIPYGFEQLLLVTTDKLAAYEKALALHLQNVRYAYLQIVQRRKHRLVKVKQRLVKGEISDFRHKTQNTSYIERFNLTLRRRVCYLQRKTLGYCKSQRNFQCVLWINLFDYNYQQFHKSLRQQVTEQPQKFQRRYQHLTPAMKMGLTSTQLNWRDLIVEVKDFGAK